MTGKLRALAVAVAAVLFMCAAQGQGTNPAPTTITIPDMDCASCAKKIGTKVAEVSGVGKVEYSVETRILKVSPKAGSNLSPKALWEAVEKGGKAPSKLEGPSGSFTKKPTG